MSSLITYNDFLFLQELQTSGIGVCAQQSILRSLADYGLPTMLSYDEKLHREVSKDILKISEKYATTVSGMALFYEYVMTLHNYGEYKNKETNQCRHEKQLTFAAHVHGYVPKEANIIELGGGIGFTAIALQLLGHRVLCTYKDNSLLYENTQNDSFRAWYMEQCRVLVAHAPFVYTQGKLKNCDIFHGECDAVIASSLMASVYSSQKDFLKKPIEILAEFIDVVKPLGHVIINKQALFNYAPEDKAERDALFMQMLQILQKEYGIECIWKNTDRTDNEIRLTIAPRHDYSCILKKKEDELRHEYTS